MCTETCIEFGRAQLREEEVRGNSVLEVGALDINGSLRPIVEDYCPSAYMGVDLQLGRGVDEICNTYHLVRRFGPDSFDLVISTELLEHVRDWRKAISNIKRVVKPGGILLITTRSRGFPYHGYPYDFWRYETWDVRLIFSDFTIETLETDSGEPGIFLKATKPDLFKENELPTHELYSMIRAGHARSVGLSEFYTWRVRNHFRSLIGPLPGGKSANDYLRGKIIPRSIRRMIDERALNRER